MRRAAPPNKCSTILLIPFSGLAMGRTISASILHATTIGTSIGCGVAYLFELCAAWFGDSRLKLKARSFACGSWVIRRFPKAADEEALDLQESQSVICNDQHLPIPKP